MALVRACLRDGSGGSPTVVVEEAGQGDAERRAAAGEWGASHAVFVEVVHEGAPGLAASLRFFTAAGELPACGHGTVAALAFLAARAPRTPAPAALRVELRTAARAFTGLVERRGRGFAASFDPGPVVLREPTADEREPVRDALGLTPGDEEAEPRVASAGRPRLLVPVASRARLAALAPDLDRLRAACDRSGLLGAYVHSPPDPQGRLAARMFAPSIGVPEDVANANSTACLAARLAVEDPSGTVRIAVDMGDSLGSPATVTATATGPGAPASGVLVGGTAVLTRATSAS
ncbi:trans-2,3-dihydro-3-hydroxyanthranilate isomerase [Actinacidiphila rubida]|uniref:Trans-2,3-dihydro-3-hydroxyanthranilate isomerase n=1 Tax=Actinacidiphila rubida TaxID=310780 RepID=A0A1H8MVU6_9ACTN|nr:PhzF family phenazine biosynthesis isomerase [Actinacidiphila rubida]SEO21368.1 trans-2,3-dihydro-3-hydroxyanthranilate isomerase [Actinacidiphila rubida]